MMPSIILKSGRDKALKRKHPWIFSNAIGEKKGSPESGATVEVLGSDGTKLGYGSFSPVSQITVRMWTFESGVEITPEFFHERLQRAVEMRGKLKAGGRTNAYRLVNAESDRMPGLIVDFYGDYLVCQFLSAGMEKWKSVIVEQLQTLVPCTGIYERSDTDSRLKEGLASSVGVLAGSEPPDLVEIAESGCRFFVDVKKGHKTGFYLDQRDNRAAVGECASDLEVLNCFSYTGGFGISALMGGAKKVVHLESSGPSLELADRNAELNGCDKNKIESICGDAFKVLRQFLDRARKFDMIVLDPPKFAASQQQVEGACRGYKDINRLAFKLLKPGGRLFTFTCSGHIEPALFDKVVADACLDAGRVAQIERRLMQGEDHPVLLSFPEGQYLKGLLCRCVD